MPSQPPEYDNTGDGVPLRKVINFRAGTLWHRQPEHSMVLFELIRHPDCEHLKFVLTVEQAEALSDYLLARVRGIKDRATNAVIQTEQT